MIKYLCLCRMGFRSRSIFARLLIKKFILTNSVLGQGCLVWSDQSLCLIVRKSGIYLSKLRGDSWSLEF